MKVPLHQVMLPNAWEKMEHVSQEAYIVDAFAFNAITSIRKEERWPGSASTKTARSEQGEDAMPATKITTDRIETS